MEKRKSTGELPLGLICHVEQTVSALLSPHPQMHLKTFYEKDCLSRLGKNVL